LLHCESWGGDANCMLVRLRADEMSGPTEPVAPGDRAAAERYRSGELIDGKYRLIRPLGRGGTGHVWVAHHVVLDVQVGLKIIQTDTEGSGNRGARLLQEARAAARLGHPAIVRIFDFGETGLGDPYVSMELLSGQTLAEALAQQSRMSATRAIQLMLPIADALAVAHAKGVVHRDVKPDNIFIACDEVGRIQPKLLDFGIARVESNLELTLQGVVLGTPEYMSPEQARGEAEIDQRTDVWSFGIVLYELIVGHPPFVGENYNSLLQSIIHQEPVPTTALAAGDAALWLLLERALQKPAALRWASMRTFGEALARWLHERGIQEDACAASLKTNWLEASAAEAPNSVPSPAAAPSEPRYDAATRPSPPQPASPGVRFRFTAIGVAALVGFAAAGYAFTRVRAARTGPTPTAASSAHASDAFSRAELEPAPVIQGSDPPPARDDAPAPVDSAGAPRAVPRLAPARGAAPRPSSKPKEYDFGF
jgi:eukaryotic-like serine/threonine-protein kinase